MDDRTSCGDENNFIVNVCFCFGNKLSSSTVVDSSSCTKAAIAISLPVPIFPKLCAARARTGEVMHSSLLQQLH
ncbi:hypothetical protein [Nostoc sp. FACHB-892]|uniref:hypothetical protein n=1 Tax=Nostoc sp. FACHB-892 TaxID=2692843 RepID=UPI001682AD0F|nr:hypothetical protein [Nostoc sp. FACHB-892]